MSTQPDILRVRGVSKRFGITQALENVSVTFAKGEVHALMGENGAGKSTLGKAIAGLHTPDSGSVAIVEDNGQERVLEPGSLDDAFSAGIRLVHQELAQCPNLSVAENLCLHDLPTTKFGMIDRPAMERRAEALLRDLEPAIDVRAPLGTLPPGHRQIVQIASSLDDAGGTKAAKVIVFDEPTSSLAVAEVDRLLSIIRSLATRGITCIYVSHRMSEIFQVCDRVTVLRDGKYVATSEIKNIDEMGLVEQMIGRKVPPPVRRARAAGDGASGPVLSVKNLSSPGAGGTPLHDISLDVEPGEILGVGGLVGAGRSELLDAIFGLDAKATGVVTCAGKAIMDGAHAGPRASIAAAMGYVPEDRKLQGLFFQLGIGENIVIPKMPEFAFAGGLRYLGKEKAAAEEKVKEFQVKAATLAHLPGSLSGGNQQKLLIARWMGHSTRVLLLDEPTRGIDVGTKAQIYELVRAAAQRGMGVLLVSSEMPELLALSDRIVVLSDGKLTGELRGDDMTQANILKLATMGH